jgi:integrase
MIARSLRAAVRTKGYREALGWIIAIAAFSGMREGEILALTADDVRKEDGIPVINVRDGKTENAVRLASLHPMIRDRLMRYAAVCKGRLFDAKNFSSWFKEYRVACGVTRERVTFHSLRHSFIGKLRAAGFSGDDLHEIVGHAEGVEQAPSAK